MRERKERERVSERRQRREEEEKKEEEEEEETIERERGEWMRSRSE